MGIRIIKKAKANEVVKPKLPPLTLRQARVVAEVGKGMTNKGAILRKAGFSKTVSRNPKKVFNKPAVIHAVNSIVSQMEANRNRIINALTKKDFTKQSPFNLTMMMNMHTKDIELLSGRPTERTAYELPEEEKEKLRKLAKLNKK